MKKIKWKGGALVAPVPPTMVTCGDMDNPNVLTIAWTGILNTQPPKTYISVRPSRHSYDMIKNSGEFVINLTAKSMLRAADFCGVRSGKDMDKFKECDLHITKGFEVNAPVLDESPLSLECKVCDIVKLGTHDMFIADIVAVDVSSDVIDSKGKLHIDKCDLVAFAHGEYFELGDRIGTFGYSVKKPVKKHVAHNNQSKSTQKTQNTKNTKHTQYAQKSKTSTVKGTRKKK